jgi:histidyl-tRNA synthetase
MAGTEGKALSLAQECRAASSLKVEVDVSGGKMKQQMRRADRIGVCYVLVLGENEVSSGKAKLKNMRGDEQIEVELTVSGLVSALSTRVP